eukprot:1156860-Pelagomonas_calceolata.AAC.12
MLHVGHAAQALHFCHAGAALHSFAARCLRLKQQFKIAESNLQSCCRLPLSRLAHLGTAHTCISAQTHAGRMTGSEPNQHLRYHTSNTTENISATAPLAWYDSVTGGAVPSAGRARLGLAWGDGASWWTGRPKVRANRCQAGESGGHGAGCSTASIKGATPSSSQILTQTMFEPEGPQQPILPCLPHTCSAT